MTDRQLMTIALRDPNHADPAAPDIAEEIAEAIRGDAKKLAEAIRADGMGEGVDVHGTMITIDDASEYLDVDYIKSVLDFPGVEVHLTYIFEV